MMTAVGVDAPSSCAAMRCGIDGFAETKFIDKGGEWIIGAQAALDEPWRGLSRLVRLAAAPIRECLKQLPSSNPQQIPLLLCAAEKERPGRLSELDELLYPELEKELGLHFHRRSGIIARGRISGAVALGAARELIDKEKVPFCLIAAADSFLSAATLAAYEEQSRLLTSQNPNGFIPGEAGAAIMVAPTLNSSDGIVCFGIGSGRETSTVSSEEPLRADGMVQAINAALAEAGLNYQHLDYRLVAANGEQYWFKEAALAMNRTLRVRKELFDIWHPADCIGETGAASVLCALSVAIAADAKGYAPGPGILCHFSNDDEQRFAMVLRAEKGVN